MTPENDKTEPESAELREKIALLDAELTEDFKAQFAVGSCLEILPTLETAAYGAVMTSPP